MAAWSCEMPSAVAASADALAPSAANAAAETSLRLKSMVRAPCLVAAVWALAKYVQHNILNGPTLAFRRIHALSRRTSRSAPRQDRGQRQTAIQSSWVRCGFHQ